MHYYCAHNCALKIDTIVFRISFNQVFSINSTDSIFDLIIHYYYKIVLE